MAYMPTTPRIARQWRERMEIAAEELVGRLDPDGRKFSGTLLDEMRTSKPEWASGQYTSAIWAAVSREVAMAHIRRQRAKQEAEARQGTKQGTKQGELF